jgi:hypothetical protein
VRAARCVHHFFPVFDTGAVRLRDLLLLVFNQPSQKIICRPAVSRVEKREGLLLCEPGRAPARTPTSSEQSAELEDMAKVSANEVFPTLPAPLAVDALRNFGQHA